MSLCVYYFASLLIKGCLVNFFLFAGTPARLRVLKNGESDHSRAVIVVGPDLTNVSCFHDFNSTKMVIGCSHL